MQVLEVIALLWDDFQEIRDASRGTLRGGLEPKVAFVREEVPGLRGSLGCCLRMGQQIYSTCLVVLIQCGRPRRVAVYGLLKRGQLG